MSTSGSTTPGDGSGAGTIADPSEHHWFEEPTEKAPNATTISQNRRRRFRDNNITESADSATIGSTTSIPAPSITTCTGKPPRAKAIVNTSVIQRRVRNAPDEQRALAGV